MSNLASKAEEVEVGQVLAGSVEAVRPYGAFVRPAWALDKTTVLVPTRLVAGFFVQAPEDVLDVGQTLFVREQKITLALIWYQMYSIKKQCYMVPDVQYSIKSSVTVYGTRCTV
jgi:polyribonucleotide nucleotidyltransferase